MIVNKTTTKSYQWGKSCEGWFFHDSSDLSIIVEVIPPGEEEKLHYHKEKSQFFFVRKGNLSIYKDDNYFQVRPGEGILVGPGERHRVTNEGKEPVEFLLISNSSNRQDKVQCEVSD